MAGKRRYLLFFLLIALVLAGCGGRGGSDTKEYYVYYTNLNGTKLEEREFVPGSDRFDGILSELLKEFQTPSHSDVVSAMPLGVSIKGYTMGVDELLVDFNATYLGISNTQEILLRAGLVKTLVQLPGVASVRITVDGQPLADSNGNVIGRMNENSFIDTRGNGINSYHYVTLNLYFSNSTGDKVVRETRNVYYSSNLIMEKVIVEQIIRGPANDHLMAVVDPSTVVKKVQISNGVCTVDLDGKFNTLPSGSTAEPETSLYAFVNAICDACDVSGVRFRIDGESNVRFRNQVNLDQIFHRKADMIEASGTAEPLEEVFLDEEGVQSESLPVSAEASAEAETDAKDAVVVQGVVEKPDGSGMTEISEKESETEGETVPSSAARSAPGPGIGVDPSLSED